MSNKQPILTIKDWQQGIADSPHLGIGLLRNADIESFPGAVKVSKQPQSFFFSGNTRTFTADASSDVCTASGSMEAGNNAYSGMAVYFTTTGTLPAGISTGTVYFLIYVSGTTFKIATSYKNSAGSAAGTQIDITDAGSGTHTVHPVAVGTVNWIKFDALANDYWFLDSNGRAWFSIDGSGRAYLLLNTTIDDGNNRVGFSDGTNGSGRGTGITLFRSSDSLQLFLFVFRGYAIDVINVTDNSRIELLSWTNAWKTMNSGVGSLNSHEAITSGVDNLIYFCDGRYLGSIQEIPDKVFAPADSTTYNYNNQSLAFPQGEIAQCLEELGQTLLIGGNTYNQIYPWDRNSSNFGRRLGVPELGIKRMKNIGSTVFILAGTWGNIYTTQGTYVRFIKKVPQYISNPSSNIISNPVIWGGIAEVNGALLFGAGFTATGGGGAFLLYPDGIYNISGRLAQDNTPSIGSANVVGLWATDTFYLMGYAGGADNFNNGQLYQSYQTVIHTSLYRLGNHTQKTKYTELEVQFAKPANSGHCRIKYRMDESSTFSDFSTPFQFNADGVSTAYHVDAGLIDIENLQLQIEMDGALELLEIRLFP